MLLIRYQIFGQASILSKDYYFRNIFLNKFYPHIFMESHTILYLYFNCDFLTGVIAGANETIGIDYANNLQRCWIRVIR